MTGNPCWLWAKLHVTLNPSLEDLFNTEVEQKQSFISQIQDTVGAGEGEFACSACIVYETKHAKTKTKNPPPL